MKLTWPFVLKSWFPLVVYMALIAFVSSLEIPPAPTIGWEHIDKVYHLSEFAILGLLAFRAFRETASGKPRRFHRVAGVTLLFCLTFGILDELHQRFVPMRESSVMDVVADVGGAIVGIGLIWLNYQVHGFYAHRSKKKGRVRPQV